MNLQSESENCATPVSTPRDVRETTPERRPPQLNFPPRWRSALNELALHPNGNSNYEMETSVRIKLIKNWLKLLKRQELPSDDVFHKLCRLSGCSTIMEDAMLKIVKQKREKRKVVPKGGIFKK